MLDGQFVTQFKPLRSCRVYGATCGTAARVLDSFRQSFISLLFSFCVIVMTERVICVQLCVYSIRIIYNCISQIPIVSFLLWL